MPTSSAPRLLFLCFTLLSHFHSSVATPRHLRLSVQDIATVEAAQPARHRAKAKTTFFEVDRPLRPPRGSSGPCSTLLLSHSFALTLTKPPVTTAYSPPSCLRGAGDVSLAVLEWRADCHGVQYDRIFGVWLGGAELLRGSTAEPRPGGVTWSVHKDVTKYTSLLATGNSTLAVYLGNLIDDTYNGVYYANLTLHLYFRRKAQSAPTPAASAPADLIVPVSRSLPLDDGLWFVVQNGTDVESTRVTVPANAYRAVLEVYVSSHYSDEFWYMNTPDQNGPFREVTVQLDGDVVGAVWPFPVIYTGGINPLIWRPITSIGSFNLPTYDIELTPFLGKLLDNKEHEVGFAVTNAQNSWYVNANLHLWLDPKASTTAGGLISHDAPKLAGGINSHSLDGIDGEYRATASRNISATGWVSSSRGNITTTFAQRLNFANTNVVSKNGSEQAINQTIDAHTEVGGGGAYAHQLHHSFPLYIFLGGNGSGTSSQRLMRKVQIGFVESRSGAVAGTSTLRNEQVAEAVVVLRDDQVAGASWRMHQVYNYGASNGACYVRNVTSVGYDVLFDHDEASCAGTGRR
ncbi:peptide-N4-(N-acetyl-beta-glucosaminyl)asparagine amidase A-like [Lolium rigidum]|uniref:peptide-N4-(N-acetyl-beta- glucosaminyl)asparagine amidase A-like n=1 Tax=Lolium rigidum TaxID=89674 RepID=UPI001F5CB44B|nr:peptide-N4-(N-acetyl-beta-glucosaminyl)asparagine amidase A-like [Lolium rigidum]XP_047055814.1 peptide-N4-(N-acetyl-beta-glucosaminyl)asparagine amidase A-like [Lolium rigidum]